MTRLHLVALLCSAGAVLCGCATSSLPQLQAGTQALRQQRSPVTISDATLDVALSTPVDAAAAVRVALLNNPQVRANLAQLGIAQGDLYDALRPAGPTLDIARLSGGGITSLAWSVSQPLLDLLFASYRRRHGELALLEVQQQVADQLLRLERDVRQAWLQHTAATLRLRVARRAAEAADLADTLAQRYYSAGNISELQWRAEQAQANTTQLHAARRETEWLVARNALLDLLGLTQDRTGLQFDARLPRPVAVRAAGPEADAEALRNRLDLAAQRSALEQAQRAYAHAQRWRLLPATSLRVESERQTGEPRLAGPGATLQLPLPNTGAGKLARAQANLALREARLQASEIAARNRLARNRELLGIAQRAFDAHAGSLLEANQRMLVLAGERQNFMLIGSFELLALRRRQIEGYELWLDAAESWWRAFNDLSYESGGAVTAVDSAATISAEDLP